MIRNRGTFLVGVKAVSNFSTDTVSLTSCVSKIDHSHLSALAQHQEVPPPRPRLSSRTYCKLYLSQFVSLWTSVKRFFCPFCSLSIPFCSPQSNQRPEDVTLLCLSISLSTKPSLLTSALEALVILALPASQTLYPPYHLLVSELQPRCVSQSS